MKKFLLSVCCLFNVLLFLQSGSTGAGAYMLPDDLYGVAVIKEKIWVCAGYGRIFHTDDGVDWEYQETGVTKSLISIDFIDENNGFAVGYWGTIIKTEDGGKNWKKVLVDNSKNFFLTDIYFIDNERGFIIGEFARLMATIDGGKSWKQMLGEDLDFMMNGIDFYDGQYGWAVGEFGTVYHSTDSGKTWAKIDVEGAEEYTLFGVKVIDKDRVVITGVDGMVLTTGDGGKSWEKKRVGEFQLFGVEFINPREGFVFGTGQLLKSNDGGNTFENIELSDELKYGFLYRMEGNVAVGSKGNVTIWDGEKIKTVRITDLIGSEK